MERWDASSHHDALISRIMRGPITKPDQGGGNRAGTVPVAVRVHRVFIAMEARDGVHGFML